MYRCEVCNANVTGPKRRHTILRSNKTIARELGVCKDCATRLNHGETLSELIEERRRFSVPAVPAYVDPPAPPPKVNEPVVLGKRLVVNRPKIK